MVAKCANTIRSKVSAPYAVTNQYANTKSFGPIASCAREAIFAIVEKDSSGRIDCVFIAIQIMFFQTRTVPKLRVGFLIIYRKKLELRFNIVILTGNERNGSELNIVCGVTSQSTDISILVKTSFH